MLNAPFKTKTLYVTSSAGIGTKNPNQALTVVGNVSSTSFYYGDGRYLTNLPSGTDTGVRALTSNWESTYTTVQSNSASWGTGGDLTVYAKLSSQAYTLVEATSSIEPVRGGNTASGNYSVVAGGGSKTVNTSLTDNIIAYYKLDDDGSGGVSLVDSTNNGNTLTNVNGTTLGQGIINGGAVFSGSTGLTQGPITANYDTYSISAWIKTNSSSEYIGQWALGGAWLFATNNGNAQFYLYNGDGSIYVNSNVNIADGNWHHWVGVVDKINQTASLFVDGVEFTNTFTYNAAFEDRNLYIGNPDHQYGVNWNDGYVDEIGIWSRELTTNEVNALYNSGAGISYPFGGGGGGTITLPANVASGDYSFIAGGYNNDTNSKENTFILGSNITAVSANYTYVNNLSSQGNITADNGTSDQWNTAYAIATAYQSTSSTFLTGNIFDQSLNTTDSPTFNTIYFPRDDGGSGYQSHISNDGQSFGGLLFTTNYGTVQFDAAGKVLANAVKTSPDGLGGYLWSLGEGTTLQHPTYISKLDPGGNILLGADPNGYDGYQQAAIVLRADGSASFANGAARIDQSGNAMFANEKVQFGTSGLGADYLLLGYNPATYSSAIEIFNGDVGLANNTANLNADGSASFANGAATIDQSGNISTTGSVAASGGTSDQWNTAYNIATAYQNTSGSFVTNTLLQSTSALLTPLTLTNTLTSQLVTNTGFNSYQTSVAASTATLLPTSTYQNTSGSFVLNTAINTLTGNWNTAYVSTTALNLSSTYWNNVYTTVQTSSGSWGTGGGGGSGLYLPLSGGTITGGVSAASLSANNIFGSGSEVILTDGATGNSTGNGSNTLSLNFSNGVFVGGNGALSATNITAIGVPQYYYLTSDGSNIGTTPGSNFFGTLTNTLLPNSRYEIEYNLFVFKTTTGAVTYALSASRTFTTGQLGLLTHGAQGNSLSTFTGPIAQLPATSSMTTGNNFYNMVKATVVTGASPTTVLLRAFASTGTLTPIANSFIKVTRIT